MTTLTSPGSGGVRNAIKDADLIRDGVTAVLAARFGDGAWTRSRATNLDCCASLTAVVRSGRLIYPATCAALPVPRRPIVDSLKCERHEWANQLRKKNPPPPKKPTMTRIDLTRTG